MSGTKQKIRCAIYTRKSSDDGLDQDFNSLDAQRETCEAYVASQRHEGWIAINKRYDDGGVSGGTLERPALKALLAEIDAGQVQMVVVYKIDRLTRSLADFAKLVERLDAASCSFVSVTQAFNTASSMGRLTLNVLLSFAQFEREVTAERIRDKIAASKKKGLWMGGVPPLGYDPHPDPKVRALVQNPDEAETVRSIFRLYAELECLNAVMKRANAMGLRSKCHVFKSGRVQGGNPFSRGQIYALLRNPIYIGRIRHKTRHWAGQHEALIDTALWDSVQAKLQAAGTRSRRRGTSLTPSSKGGNTPLMGKLRDETGDRLTPTHTRKGGKQVRYYISNRLVSGGADPSGWRLPAAALEQACANAIAGHLEALADSHQLCSIPDLLQGNAIRNRVRDLTTTRANSADTELLRLLVEGRIRPGAIELVLDGVAVAAALAIPHGDIAATALRIEAPLALRRRGVEGKLILGERQPYPDRTLIRALSRAHEWAAALRAGKQLSDIAADTRHSESYIRTRTQLAFLAPALQLAILDGHQPADLTLERIIRKPIPLDWQEQARLYGF